MRCPRCHLETGDPAPAFCRGCGAPLRLPDEPPARPLDVPLALDRRGDRAPRESDEPWRALALHAQAPGEVARPATPPAPAVRRAGPEAAPAEALPAATADESDLPDAEVDALEIRLRRPETWRRAAAAVIDVGPFVAGGAALVTSLLGGAGVTGAGAGLDGLLDAFARERTIVLSVAAALAVAVGVYSTLAHALAGATLGKRLLGLAVVGPDARRPSLGRSAARAGLALLSAALLGLGLLLALFTRSGRALHDFTARTWVVDARGGPAPLP